MRAPAGRSLRWAGLGAAIWLAVATGGRALASAPATAPPDTSAAAPDTVTAPASSLADLARGARDLQLTEIEIEERLAAVADSMAADGYDVEEIIAVQAALRDSLEALQEQIEIRPGPAPSIFYDLSNTVDGGVQATVTKVNYKGGLTNSVRVAGGGVFSDNLAWSYDSFRRQIKTTESRSARGNYESGYLLPFRLSMQAGTNWSEDLTTNAAGNTNVNRREMRRAGISASKSEAMTGPVRHNLQADWFFNDQKAINQQQRNDFQEGELSGAVRSGVAVAEGLNLATRLYRISRDGESNLADFVSPSSATGDSLGAGAYYNRPPLQGQFTITRASFDKRYLDFRRNSNGLIDTTNLPEGVSKIVQELEEQDALSLNWDNTIKRGRYQASARLRRSVDRQQYARSLVGRRERSNEAMDLQFIVPVGRDSFAIGYIYEWNWDDQRFADATAFRGRQYRKRRDVSLDWQRRLFQHTTISGRYRTELAQDIAQNIFNENDRDRLTEEGRLRLEAFWRQRFRAMLVAEYQSIHDVSIRASRSANNDRKRTFEVAPGYRYFFNPRLELAQTFRMYIQFQDFDYADLPTVNKNDSFNKRGSLATSLKMTPNDRLEVTIKHDHNERYNGTRTVRDAAGNRYYRRDQDQTISRVELGFSWTAASWSPREYLKFQTATYRTRDTVERFGPTSSTTTERYSGELWIGAVFNRRWGPQANPLHVDASVRRYLAYGPNVTDTSKDYWQADVSLKWSF